MALKSKSTISIIDILCEGPIEGFADPIKKDKTNNSVLFNDNPVKLVGTVDDIETQNNAAVFIDLKRGTTNQTEMENFGKALKTEIITINKEIGSNYSETLTSKNTVKSRDYGQGQIIQKIIDTEATKIQIIFTIPSLFSQALEGVTNGQLFSATINYEVFIKGKETGYVKKFKEEIKGISTTNYQIKTSPISLKKFKPPYHIKIKKITNGEDDFEVKKTDLVQLPKNTPFGNKRGNRLVCTSINLITPNEEKFTNMAYVGAKFSSEHFPTLPTRSYLIKGKKVKIFSNVEEVRDDGSLSFDNEVAFDGTFKAGRFWTTCPVCIFIDMLTNKTYGAGNFVSLKNISLVDLYPLARYCNQLVNTPDGKEPRFAINTVIASQTSAYKLLQTLASTFRGMTFWASNTVNVIADHGNLDKSDIDPVHLYNNSNVIDGIFNYSGTSIKTRSSRVIVNYNDQTNNYKIDNVIVEDQDLIDKFGVNEKEIVAFGCTSKHQAQRLGQWTIKSEELDAEIVTFATGLDGLGVLPGQVFAVADLMRAAQRTGGRVSSATTTAVTIDQSVQLPAGDNKKLSCILSDGTLETKDIDTANTSGTTITVSSAFSSAPLAQSVYVISTDNVQKQKFRCIDLKDNNNGTYTVTGVQHNDSIYDVADDITSKTTDLEVDNRTISAFDEAPRTPTDLAVTFTQVVVNNNTVNRALFQWSRGTNGPSITFNVQLEVNGKVTQTITDQTVFEADNMDPGTEYIFQVAAIGFFGKQSAFRQLEDVVPSVSTTSTTGSITITPPAELVPDPL